MKKETKQIVINEFKKIEDDAIIITSKENGFTDIAIIRNKRTQFIVELSESESLNKIELQQIYPIHGYVDKYSVVTIEDAITIINMKLQYAE